MKTKILKILLIILLAAVYIGTGPTTIRASSRDVASWYGDGEKLNKHTASGEIFNPKELTCASWDYDFNTLLKVTNITNGKSIVVRVNDRGPNKRLGRTVDLTKFAFSKIADIREGLIFVKVEKHN